MPKKSKEVATGNVLGIGVGLIIGPPSLHINTQEHRDGEPYCEGHEEPVAYEVARKIRQRGHGNYAIVQTPNETGREVEMDE